jgi:hypothetical protein
VFIQVPSHVPVSGPRGVVIGVGDGDGDGVVTVGVAVVVGVAEGSRPHPASARVVASPIANAVTSRDSDLRERRVSGVRPMIGLLSAVTAIVTDSRHRR